MDDIDRELMILITASPRISFVEISKKLGISRQAAHHRLQVLIDSGVIKGMTADMSAPYLDAIPVGVHGRSRAASIEKVLDKLGEGEFTRRAIVGGGGNIYVNGQLRDISELGEFSEFVIRVAELQDPIVGLLSPEPGLMPHYSPDGIVTRKESYKELSPLDLRIIAALRGNVRRSASEIAKVIGVTTKTVSRRLDDMISEGSLELHVRWDSTLVGDMYFVAQVTLRDGADSGTVGRRLLKNYPFKDAFFVAYGNMPNFLTWIFWTSDMSEMRRILRVVDEDEDVVSLVPNFVFLERIYSNWRSRLDESPGTHRKVSSSKSGHPLSGADGSRSSHSNKRLPIQVQS
jgi:DNA-binding Lrp family transcriptional regulator